VLDTFDGLPVHALVVHATVVLLPLMSIVTMVVAALPRWRRSLATYVAIADGLLVPLTYVTIESGENFQARLSALAGGSEPVAAEHGERGHLMLYFAIALFVAGLAVAAFARRGGVLSVLSLVLAVVVGASVLGWTYVVGESGASSVWRETIANTPDP
jgi:hypothetical protein